MKDPCFLNPLPHVCLGACLFRELRSPFYACVFKSGNQTDKAILIVSLNWDGIFPQLSDSRNTLAAVSGSFHARYLFEVSFDPS
jgi:hypothetical protein